MTAYVIDTGIQRVAQRVRRARQRAGTTRWMAARAQDGLQRPRHPRRRHHRRLDVRRRQGRQARGRARPRLQRLGHLVRGHRRHRLGGERSPARRPAVANMSLGGGASTAVDTAVKNAIADRRHLRRRGRQLQRRRLPLLTRPCARGDHRRRHDPDTDAKASYSNYGKCLDLWAPGSSITSAWIGGDSATQHDQRHVDGDPARRRGGRAAARGREPSPRARWQALSSARPPRRSSRPGRQEVRLEPQGPAPLRTRGSVLTTATQSSRRSRASPL